MSELARQKIITDFIIPKLSGKKIFLTGGTGFFGRSLLDLLIGQNIADRADLKLTLLSRDPNIFLNSWPKYSRIPWLKFTQGAIESFKFNDEAFDFILHFATPASASLNKSAPLQMSDVILNGTRRALDFCVKSGASKFLFASSGAVYGRQPPEINCVSEDMPIAPATHILGSAYGEAKRMAELWGCEYSRKNNFDFKIARCFAFVGPHLDQDGSFAIGNFIKDAVLCRDIQINGDGTPMRSYLYSDDLIIWLFKILIDGKSCEPYNVGSDVAISILELAKKVAYLLNPEIKINIAKTANINALPERYVPSIQKARKELDLDVWTDLDNAILASSKGFK